MSLKRSVPSLRIPRLKEAQHFMALGDSGVGKTALMRQLMCYAEACGDIVVAFDPEREYIQEFYDERRGDWVLNPADERVPYWNMADEGEDQAEFMALANSLFPPMVSSPSGTDIIFRLWTTDLFCFLMSRYKPDTAEFGDMLNDFDRIDEAIKGTSLENTLTQNAGPQRAGIIGMLQTAGRPLGMMPREQQDRRRLCLREWAKDPHGWIFLTSAPTIEDSIRPLQSMWMDLIILRLLSTNPVRRVWMLFDELHALQHLPQLHNGITRMRKRGHVIVIGIQNREQLIRNYGRYEKTIFSQCRTKFIFATSDGESAKGASDLIGDVEMLRLKESRSRLPGSLRPGSHTTTVERVREPLVLPSEIQSLDDLNAFMVERGKVVKLKLPWIDLDKRAPAWIPRPIPPPRVRETAPEPDLVGATVTRDVATGVSNLTTAGFCWGSTRTEAHERIGTATRVSAKPAQEPKKKVETNGKSKVVLIDDKGK